MDLDDPGVDLFQVREWIWVFWRLRGWIWTIQERAIREGIWTIREWIETLQESIWTIRDPIWVSGSGSG